MEIHGHNFWWLAGASVSAGLILGHNLWLVVKDRAVKSEAGVAPVRVEVNTSDDFPASESAVRPERVADFRLFAAGGSAPVTGYRIEGPSLVAFIEPPRAVACLVALELHPHPIVLEAEKFASYVRDEDADRRVAPRFAEGKTTRPQRESYTKYAKALVESGTGTGDVLRLVVGHRLEIVPQLSPASARRGGGRLPVRVLFDGEPIAGLRLSSGCAELGGRYASHTHTDEDGHARIELTTPGHWFVRAHHIRPHHDSETADWESFWASLTFHVPR